jgi:hypothetical protein
MEFQLNCIINLRSTAYQKLFKRKGILGLFYGLHCFQEDWKTAHEMQKCKYLLEKHPNNQAANNSFPVTNPIIPSHKFKLNLIKIKGRSYSQFSPTTNPVNR